MKKFENKDFTEEELLDLINEEEVLEKYEFLGCRFRGCDFSGAVLLKCRFERCDFSGSKFNGGELILSAFLNCKFRFASFFATTVRECKMTGSDFGDADINCINIIGGDWSYTCLKELDFSKTELCGIQFEGADMTGCMLEKCRIDRCGFYGAVLLNASFKGSDLRGSDLNGIEASEVNLQQTRVDLERCVAIAASLGAIYTP